MAKGGASVKTTVTMAVMSWMIIQKLVVVLVVGQSSIGADVRGSWPVAVLGWGQGGTGPPNLAQAPPPKKFSGLLRYIQGGPKKLHTVFIAITLSTLSQFS